MVEAPFQQWGLDFIGQFKDNSSNGYAWIITATDYFTKWVESIATKSETNKVVMDFIEDNIITRFSVSAKITTDNAKAFSSTELSSLCFKNVIYCPTLQTTIPKEMVLLSLAIRT